MNLNHYAHPEFGYLCPAPRLRRDLSVAFFALLFGASVGAVTAIALYTEDRDGNPAYAARPAATEPRSEPMEHAGGVKPALPSADIPGSHQAKSTAGDTPLSARSPGSEKTRTTEKLHEPMVSPTHDGPDIARVPSDRPAPFATATPTGVSEPSGAWRSPPVAPAPAGISEPLRTDDVARERVHSPPLLHAKPHKIARVHNRRHEPSERVAGAPSGLESGFSLGSTYARDTSYPRTGFWDWSR
jgi:hypothetical protein